MLNSPQLWIDYLELLYLSEISFDQAIINHWQEDNKKFIPTRACHEVEKLIKSQNLVVVTGNSGSGKSAIIQHIALCYKDQGWTVKPVYSVKEIVDAYSSVNKSQNGILFVFNDPFGNESFDEIAFKPWEEERGRLKVFLKKVKMLLSCRKYILDDAGVGGILKDKPCVIDLSNDKHKLNDKEKQQILESYSSNSDFVKKNIDEIMKTEQYFPLLCKLYFSDEKKQKIGVRFF